MFKKIITLLVGIFLTLFSTLATPATVGPWSLSNPTAIGSSILYDGLKGKITSSVLITPNAPQVAKVLAGGGAGFALSFAVEQLLGAVDWVMDPANNQIKYINPNKICESRCLYWVENVGSFNTPKGACKAYQTWLNISLGQISRYASLDFTRDREDTSPSLGIGIGYCGGYIYMADGSIAQSHGLRIYYDSTAQIEMDNLSLETVAQQIIENAQSTNVSAQLAILEAANASLIEAQQDETKSEPIINTLENNANCPSGIVNNGSCWICSKESHAPIRGRVVYAKEVVYSLNKCSANMNSSELLTRFRAYSELGAARDAENACWTPQHDPHIREAEDAKRIASECNKLLGLLGK